MRTIEQFLAIAVIGTLLFAAVSTTAPASAASEVIVTKTASPADIFLQGTGSPENTQVTLTVQGFGGTLTETVPIDVVFSIDSSGSMTTYDPSGLRKTAAKSFVDKLDSSRDQGGVVSWDSGVNFSFGLTRDFAALKTKAQSTDSPTSPTDALPFRDVAPAPANPTCYSDVCSSGEDCDVGNPPASRVPSFQHPSMKTELSSEVMFCRLVVPCIRSTPGPVCPE